MAMVKDQQKSILLEFRDDRERKGTLAAFLKGRQLECDAEYVSDT